MKDNVSNVTFLILRYSKKKKRGLKASGLPECCELNNRQGKEMGAI